MAEKLGTPVDERLAELVEQTFKGDNQISSPKAKIQRIPAFLLKDPNFAKHCSPKMISFGPIHHRNEDLKLGQQFKIQWTSLYIEEYSNQTNQSASEAASFLYNIIEDNIEELKKLFNNDVIESYNDEELAWMLFVDGCSLLYYMDTVDGLRPEALKLKIDLLTYLRNDILLLGNQLPRTVLELLRKYEGADLEFLMLNFISNGKVKRDGMKIIKLVDNPTPIHILDYFRSSLISTEEGKNIINQNDGARHNQRSPHTEDQDIPYFWQRYKNIRDIKIAGIQVKANKIDASKWHNISFTSGWFGGELRLPKITFGPRTHRIFRNLIAYEMCPDFHNNFECCSFISFMDSLIDDAEDVKELRLAGVIQNFLGSDEAVAKIFNELGEYLPILRFNHKRSDAVAYSKIYVEVKLQIEKHYKTKWKWWLADARNTYFSTPWSLLAFLAALLALVLTFIQTWYAVRPK